LSVPVNADGSFSAETVNGGISSDFPALIVKQSPGSHSLKGNLSEGSAIVKASTVNGAIQILRTPAVEPKP